MKKWLYPLAALALAAAVFRLPHPARDVAKLDPVRAVYLYMEGEILHMETDTGDTGSGETLAEAAEHLKSMADAEIFLETAEYLILSPDVEITPEFYALLRPAVYVIYAATAPDLRSAADYLAVHTPDLTLAQIRAG